MCDLKGETTKVQGTGLTAAVNILTQFLTSMLINRKHQGNLQVFHSQKRALLKKSKSPTAYFNLPLEEDFKFEMCYPQSSLNLLMLPLKKTLCDLQY